MFVAAEEYAQWTGSRWGSHQNRDFHITPTWFIRWSGGLMFVGFCIKLLMS